MKGSFSIRLTRYIGGIISILFIAVMSAFALFSHKLIVEEATNALDQLLQATILKMEKTLDGVESSVNNNLWLVREHIDDKKYLTHITTGIIEDNANINGSAVAFSQFYFGNEIYYSPFSYRVGGNGYIACKQLGNQDYDYFSMEWFSVPAETGMPAWSEPYTDTGGSEQTISTYSCPVKDEYGNLIAVVTADVPVELFTKIAEEAKPYPNSTVTVTSKREESDKVADGIDAKNRVVSVSGKLSNGWAVGMQCDYEDVLRSASQLLWTIIILGLIGLCLLSLAIYLVIQHLTKPLNDFSESAISIAKGNFNTTLPVIKSDDEIHRLRDSFDYMQQSLLTYMENLKAETAAKERYVSELNIASSIQNSMLPHTFPDRDGLDMYAEMKPAKEVGGDLYDFHVKGQYLYFSVGDVSGKGVPAALFMAITRMALHFVPDHTNDLAQRMTRINTILSSDNNSNLFVTLLTCALNLETGEMLYCNAGHNPAVILHPDGRAEFLDQKPNLAVGVWPGFEYVMQKVTLEKGAKILLYTDGVSEAERADKSQYGEQRLLEWARNSQRAGEMTAKDACKSLFDDIHLFTEGNEQNDDITIMTIKI